MDKRPSDFSGVLREQIRSVLRDLQHHGAAGSSIEEILRAKLRSYVPSRFAVHNGFIRSLDYPEWESHEIDVIFTQESYARPIVVYPTHSIYPIEAVIGILEVTRTFTLDKMKKDFAKAEEVQRCIGGHYDVPLNIARLFLSAEDLPAFTSEMADRITRVTIHWGDLHPRFFYFAFASKPTRHETICRYLSEVKTNLGVHLHGMLILSKGYYKHRPSVDSSTIHDVLYISDPERAFLAFINDLVDSFHNYTQPPPASSIPIRLYNRDSGPYEVYQP